MSIEDRHRRQIGAVLGGILGLTYGLVTQYGSQVGLAGIRLYQPPFGALGNTIVCVMVGLAVGLAATWASASMVGVLWSGALAGAAVLAAAAVTGQIGGEGLIGKVLALFFIFLPVGAAMLPVTGAFRWVINHWQNTGRDRQPLALRLLPPLALALAFGALGLLSMYRTEAKTRVVQMDQMLRASQAAGSVEALDKPLQPPDVKHLLEHAGQPYTLAWERDERNRFAIPRPAAQQNAQSIVIAYYPDGYRLVCLFFPQSATPECRDILPE